MDSALLVAVGVPTVLFAARQGARAVRHEWNQLTEQRRPPPPPATVPIERVASTLRRLRSELETRENRPGLSGKGMRLGAVRLAYVDVLAVACCQLDVPPPRTFRDCQTPLAEIYRVEAALRERGLDVREPVRHAA